ncbi:hypothetical protein SDC9_203981 [bioreactor metagenome]|uniref:DUF3006 domain-containing protein n=1 Tax=bioreactor metagenome TaxID=1076179 RepID=A0A645IXX8_9ZZZZ
MNYFSVDRLENGFAILEDNEKNTFKISLKILPKNIKETDIVFKKNNRYYIDSHKASQIKSKIQTLQIEIFDKES